MPKMEVNIKGVVIIIIIIINVLSLFVSSVQTWTCRSLYLDD